MKKDQGSERANNLPKVTESINGITGLKSLVESKARDYNPYIIYVTQLHYLFGVYIRCISV